MQLYTINATPVREDASNEANAININQYPDVVAQVLKGWGFDGFTIYKVDGYWQGLPEVSFKIEIALDKDFSKVYNVAEELRDKFNQDSVMVTDSNNKVIFV